jgi:hypothetical protein
MVTTHRRPRPHQDSEEPPLNPLIFSTLREARTIPKMIRRRPNTSTVLMVVIVLFVVIIWSLIAARLLLVNSPSQSKQTPRISLQQHSRPLHLGNVTTFSKRQMQSPHLRGHQPSPEDILFDSWKRNYHTTNLSMEDRQIHFVYGLWDTSDGDPNRPGKSANKHADNSNMPLSFRHNLQVYQAQNPDWIIHTWFNKTEIERLVALWTSPEHPPSASSFGRDQSQAIRHAWAVARPVQRADLFRYLLLYQFGGFYFDLDVVTSGNNTVAFFMDQVGLNPSLHTAALFWEMGRLTLQEQAKSAKEIVRRGLPEYRTRLSNYCIWSKPNSKLTKCAIELASSRILYVQKNLNFTTVQQRIPVTLYSSGPDVVTECAFGVRRSDEMDGTTTKSTMMEEEDEVVKNHMTRDKVLVVDPGPNLINGNMFSWRNKLAA